MIRRVILAASLVLVAAAAEASTTLKIPVFAMEKDQAAGSVYAVPSVRDPFKGYVNPCTYRSLMAGLPVNYAVLATVPLQQRDRLMEKPYLDSIIQKAAGYFLKVCPQAKFYSMDGPPSAFNTNKLNVYVLLTQDWHPVPYRPDSGSDTYDRQYAVEAILVPSGDGRGWVLPADARIDNRVVADAPERRRQAEQARMAAAFDTAQQARMQAPRLVTALGGGELLADLGPLDGGRAFAQTWATDWRQACDMSVYSNLRSVLKIRAEALLPLDKNAIQKLLADAAGAVRGLCPQTRHCQTYRHATFNNPLAPPPPETSETKCTYQTDKTVDVVLVPPDVTWTRRGDLTDIARTVLASAQVSADGKVGSYNDGTLAAMRRSIAEAKKRQASRALFDRFVKQYAIATWPNRQALAANPFVYQGKIVGLYASFERMLTADSALFSAGSSPLLVTGIPTAAFTTPGAVLLAASVVGTKQVRLPIVGEMSVPHLAYVGAHVCAAPACSELLAWEQ